MDDILRNVLLIFANLIVVSVAIIGYYVLLRHLPNIHLNILPRWFDRDSGLLIIRIEIENPSKIRVFKRFCKLQICEYGYPEEYLSEWIWFEDPRNKSEMELKEEPIPLFPHSALL